MEDIERRVEENKNQVNSNKTLITKSDIAPEKEDSPLNRRVTMLEKNVTITPVHSHSVPKTTYLSTDCRFRLKIEVKIEGKIPYDEEKQLFCPQELQIPFWGFVKKKASEYGALQAEYKNKIMNLDSQQLEEVALGANWLNYLRQTYWMSYKTCKIGANVPLDKVDTMHYDERFVDHGLKETFRKVKASIKGSMGTRSAKQAESTRRSNEKRRKEKLDQ